MVARYWSCAESNDSDEREEGEGKDDLLRRRAKAMAKEMNGSGETREEIRMKKTRRWGGGGTWLCARARETGAAGRVFRRLADFKHFLFLSYIA